jgi:hypothetical protein
MQWFAGNGGSRHNELTAVAAIYGLKAESFWPGFST